MFCIIDRPWMHTLFMATKATERVSWLLARHGSGWTANLRNAPLVLESKLNAECFMLYIALNNHNVGDNDLHNRTRDSGQQATMADRYRNTAL